MAPPQQRQQGQGEGIPIQSLSPQELVNVRDRVEADFERMAASQQQLSRIITRYAASGQSIETLAASKEGHPLLLPLTSSLYVPGKVADTEKVLVDVGTGYYIEMTVDKGADYCKRKVLKLKENLEAVNQAAQEKRMQLMQINTVLQSKVAALSQQAEQKG